MTRVIQRLAVLLFLLSNAPSVWACPECRMQVNYGVYGEDFVGTLLIVMLPIIVLATIGVGIHYASDIKAKLRERASKWQTISNVRP